MKKGNVFDLGLIRYAEAMRIQQELIKYRKVNQIDDVLLILQHFSVITVGSSGNRDHILIDDETLNKNNIDIHFTNRGGDVTFHGPGQIVVYPLINLKELGMNVYEYVRKIEEVVIKTLREFKILGIRKRGLPGVWVDDEKICSVGLKISQGVTMHGFALNVNTDLNSFKLIIPCGLREISMTSMEKILKKRINTEEVNQRLVLNFSKLFNIGFIEKGFLKLSQYRYIS